MPDINKAKGKHYNAWFAENPVLPKGSVAVVTYGQDIGKRKIGDGVKHWRDLPYEKEPLAKKIKKIFKRGKQGE